MFYKLDGKKVVPVGNISELNNISVDDRIVRRTTFADGRILSTVFLMVDHGYVALNPVGEPILFETMVFGDPEGDEILRRYSNWDDAEKWHLETVKHMVELGASVTKQEFRYFHEEIKEEDAEETNRFDLIDLE